MRVLGRQRLRTLLEHPSGIRHPADSNVLGRHAKLSPMPLILILIILLVLFGGGGYYMGPGIGYYGGGGISLILALIVIYLLFGRGRERL
jgi:hypothetical protein